MVASQCGRSSVRLIAETKARVLDGFSHQIIRVCGVQFVVGTYSQAICVSQVCTKLTIYDSGPRDMKTKLVDYPTVSFRKLDVRLG